MSGAPSSTEGGKLPEGVIRIEKVTDDGGVLKEVRAEGTGPLPNKGDEVVGESNRWGEASLVDMSMYTEYAFHADARCLSGVHMPLHAIPRRRVRRGALEHAER
jgi:hypothetical protein